MKTFFGKYRATVIHNIDPMQIGRLQLQIPDALGPTISPWALPCVPFAGPQAGILALPPIGASVWAEFEAGDPNRPIWTGGFWSTAADLPSSALLTPPPAESITLQTIGQNRIRISDAPGPAGGLQLIASDGAAITINSLGITLINAKGAILSLAGPNVTITSQAPPWHDPAHP